MTKQEIDNLIKKGEPLIIEFRFTEPNFYIGQIKISEKQFGSAINRFEDKLDFKREYSRYATHYYTLKDIYL